MDNIHKALHHLEQSMGDQNQRTPIPFNDFLDELIKDPVRMIRNIFQVFYDMIKTYVGEGTDEYPDDPESIQFVSYDCARLFVEGSDHPFFADRLFANRLMNHVEAFKGGAQQNRIYIFDGPPGCGKSTFLNNLLMKFEEYANTEAGIRYENVWRLDRKILGCFADSEALPLIEKLSHMLDSGTDVQEKHVAPETPDGNLFDSEEDSCEFHDEIDSPYFTEDYIEVPCPCHDHPLLMIPKKYRRSFFDELFENDEFKWKLFTDKEFDWVFRDVPCTICSSIYDALMNRLKSPMEVFKMLYARPYHISRRLGEGISVFNPGDMPMKQNVLTNNMLQKRINSLLGDSNQVKYLFSNYAKTNNGIYALMDIKTHNVNRLIELHNIISEGVHKVVEIEENVDSLFMALMNPEDKKNIQDFQSFSDRIEYINIPYVLDLRTEVEIYRNIFGKHIDESFLPRVLHNFARVIIASRLKPRSDAMLDWIKDPKKYSRYCDEKLQLLKMEIYTGHIPDWLSEEDLKRFNAKRRRFIVKESEIEGESGFSGRDSIKIFNEFYANYAKEDKLINMSRLIHYFTTVRKDLNKSLPKGFLDSLLQMYDYTILQEVKESLYNYNEERISSDIQNYLFAVNFEPGAVETCSYTGEKLEITEEFFKAIESRLLSPLPDQAKQKAFRLETQKEYTTKTLTQEIMLEGIPMQETALYNSLHERYVQNLKEKVLDPFLDNENFRQGIKDFDSEAFKTYDKRIREDVTFLIDNLCNKCRYTQKGAKEVCIYVIDSDLARKFGKP
ncbi:serine protein kinase PrkA [Desulfobacterales bacterium HSG16]|nr:serine protein kinase PrkA [Desulfobacterales bacterium HSG16]